jgi:hypothetical protein
MGSGAGRVLLLFLCLGKLCRAIREDSSTLARHLGGVMDEERVGRDGESAEKRLGPEKGPVGIVQRVKQALEQSMHGDAYMLVILEIAKGLEIGRLPDVKFMTDFLKRLQALEQVPQEEYDSFAAVLWRECRVIEGDWEEATERKE